MHRPTDEEKFLLSRVGEYGSKGGREQTPYYGRTGLRTHQRLQARCKYSPQRQGVR